MTRSYRQRTIQPAKRRTVETMFDETTAAYKRYQESRNLSHHTLKITEDCLNLLRAFLGGNVPITAITTVSVREFHAWLKVTPMERPFKGSLTRSPGGIANRMRSVRTFAKWLTEENYLPYTVKVKEPAVSKELFEILSNDELDRVFSSSYCRDDEQGRRNRALFTLMLDTGLRVGEVGTLNTDDLLLDDRLVRVMGKGRKARYVPFSTTARTVLERWLATRGDQLGLVFELKTSSIQSLYRHIARELEIAKFHPHAMRHTAATMMLRGGMDIESLRRILGHTNITTTARYLSLQTEDLRDKLDAASPVASMTPSSPVQVRRRRLQRERTPLRLIKTG